MNREDMLSTIDALYEERIAGLTETMSTHLAEGATFRMAGEGQMQAAFGSDGPVDFLTAMTTLNTAIKMHKLTRLTALAEGNRCAVMLRITVQFHDREPFDTEIFNLWSFDEAGKVASVIEFVDTARLVGEVQMLGGVWFKSGASRVLTRCAIVFCERKRERRGEWAKTRKFLERIGRFSRGAEITLFPVEISNIKSKHRTLFLGSICSDQNAMRYF